MTCDTSDDGASVELRRHLLTLPNGKFDRSALAPPDRTFREYVAPRNEVERRLVDIWQEVLRVPRVGVTDTFFELGGD